MKIEGLVKMILAGCACLAIVLAALLFIAPSAGAESRAPDSIKIGAVIPLTGKFASGGNMVKLGYEIAVDFINENGGVYVKEFGKKLPLDLKILDDESDPVKTVSKLETLNDAHKVTAYLGGFGSALHAAAAAVAEKNKIPYLGASFSLYVIHEKGYKYLFSPFSKTPFSIKTIFEMLKTVSAPERPKRIAIFRLATDWGIEQADLIHKFAPPEYKIVTDIKFSPRTKNFSSLILKAKAAKADALWTNPISPDGIAMVRQMKELDWNPKFLYIVRASGNYNWIKALGSAGDYAVAESTYHWSYPYPGNKKFVDECKKRSGLLPQNSHGTAYVCVQILADAIERAGSFNRDKIRDAIATTNMASVIGRIRFNPDGTVNMFNPDGTINAIGAMSQWIDQKRQLVWPPDLANSQFVYPAKPFKER